MYVSNGVSLTNQMRILHTEGTADEFFLLILLGVLIESLEEFVPPLSEDVVENMISLVISKQLMWILMKISNDFNASFFLLFAGNERSPEMNAEDLPLYSRVSIHLVPRKSSLTIAWLFERNWNSHLPILSDLYPLLEHWKRRGCREPKFW